MKKIMRVAAIPNSLNQLLNGQLRFLNDNYEIVGVASPDLDLHKLLREREGIRTAELPISRRIDLLADLRSLWLLYRLFRRERPDAVHSLTPKAGLLSMMAAKAAGVPVRVHSFTGLIFPWKSGAMSRLLRYMDMLLSACATHLLPEGEGVRSDLIKHSVTNKPMRVLANGNINGVDLEWFAPQTRPKVDGVTRFVFVGRMVKDKGIEELRSAFERLDGEVELIMVGNFEQKLDPISQETYDWLHSSPKVRLVGFQSDIRSFLAEADVFVLPSHREGFPNSPMQAGAMERASIVTDICGCNEVVVDGETGLLVEPHSAESLYQAMKRLSEDSELCRSMGIKARERVTKLFDQKVVWNALLDFYKEVV